MKPEEGTTKGTKRTKMIRYGIRFTRRYGAMGRHLKHRNVYLRSLTPFSGLVLTSDLEGGEAVDSHG
jgi:hypothetical protein